MCHPTFATTPSGTDINTINDEGDERNHFVSLIVSNTCPYSARITRKIKKDIKLISTEEWSYKSWNDELIELEPFTDETAETKYIIECYPLNIEVEDVEIERDELQIRMDELDNSSNSYANKTNPFGFRGASNATSKFGYPMSPIDSYESSYIKTYNKEDPKQLTLWTENKQEVFDKEQILNNLVDAHFNLIVTGDIFGNLKVKNPKTPEYLNNYKKNMEALYKKRFNIKVDFELYADAIIEYCYEDTLNATYNLVNEIEDPNDDGTSIIADWVNKLTIKLESIQNYYSEYFKLKLTQYI